MRQHKVWALCAVCFLVGTSLGLWAKGPSGGGIGVMKGKPMKEAGLAALAEAEKLAGKGSWERIGVGRVYYLSGDKARGQAMFDAVTSAKPEPSDWQRIGEVYAEAGEKDKAEACFQKVLVDPKDDTGQSEIGSWYIRAGQREKGEELIAKALSRNPDDVALRARGRGVSGSSEGEVGAAARTPKELSGQGFAPGQPLISLYPAAGLSAGIT